MPTVMITWFHTPVGWLLIGMENLPEELLIHLTRHKKEIGDTQSVLIQIVYHCSPAVWSNVAMSYRLVAVSANISGAKERDTINMKSSDRWILLNVIVWNPEMGKAKERGISGLLSEFRPRRNNFFPAAMPLSFYLPGSLLLTHMPQPFRAVDR